MKVTEMTVKIVYVRTLKLTSCMKHDLLTLPTFRSLISSWYNVYCMYVYFSFEARLKTVSSEN